LRPEQAIYWPNFQIRRRSSIWCNEIKISTGTWALALSEEHGLRASEIGMLRGILGPKRDEVTGD
jgi:hypothetical protein